MRRFSSLKLFSYSLFIFIFFLCITTSLHYFSLNVSHLNFQVYAQDDGGSGGGDSGGGDSGGGDSSGADSGGGDTGGDSSGGDQSSDSGVSGDPGDPGGDGGAEPDYSSPETQNEGSQETSTTADFTVTGNSVSFDQPTDVSSISIPSAGIDIPGDAGTTSIQGPEGMTATVTDNGDGTVSVSFSPPDSNVGSEVGGEPAGVEVGGDAQGGNNEGNTQGGGDNPSNTGPTPPPNVGPVPCINNCSPTPPSAFSQYQPVALACDATGGNPTIRTTWSSSANFSDYYIYYLDSSEGVLRGGWSTGRREYFDFTSSSSLIPGHQYGFVIAAVNNRGYQTISDNGQWSHQKFGTFTTYPDCTPPGAFNMSEGTPKTSCPSAGNSQVELKWDPSSLADYYVVTWVNQRTGAQGQANVGAARAYNIPGLTTGDPYVFLIEANRNVNQFKSFANGNWVGSVTIPNCSPPSFTTFTLTSGGRSTSPGNAPLTIKQAEAFDINWNVTNTSSCTASTTAAPGSEPLTPVISNTWVVNPKPISGTHSFGVNQITSKGTYDFTLTCTNPVNSAISASASVSLKVKQLRNPYIEFQGDFHTNESINIAR